MWICLLCFTVSGIVPIKMEEIFTQRIFGICDLVMILMNLRQSRMELSLRQLLIAKEADEQYLKNCLALNQEYEDYVTSLEKVLPPHCRCHHIFTKNDSSYRCKDCSFGDSSCMCSECFDVNLHSVRVVFTVNGRIMTIVQKWLLKVVAAIVETLLRGKRSYGAQNISVQQWMSHNSLL